MAHTLTIRPARSEDAVAILRVHREAILTKEKDHYEQSTLDAWALGVTPERVARVETQIANPEFIVMVAEVSDEVVGFAMAVPSRQQLRAVYVKQNAIGQVGTALLHELEKQAFATTEKLVCDASLNAVEFYTANGYTEESRTDHVLTSGASVPGVRMRKVRPPSKG